MTANHAHTPSNEKVTTFFKTLRMMYQTRMVELQHPSDDKDHMEEYGQNFDKLMAARDTHIEAAAEQRGEKSALLRAEKLLEEDRTELGEEVGVDVILRWLRYLATGSTDRRADQEGDDE